jgi:sigma-B regulation protein RsbU (phosphoserine phosphatase)
MRLMEPDSASNGDVSEARGIQEKLLRPIPKIRGVEIAKFHRQLLGIGGDFYDVSDSGHDKLSICIADVRGKGPPAALVMAYLARQLADFGRQDRPPDRFCQELDKEVRSQFEGHFWLTAFVCRLDYRKYEMFYTNAGHERPILVPPSGPAVFLDGGGAPLGMPLDLPMYEQYYVRFGRDYRLLLYTDGVTEAEAATQAESAEVQHFDVEPLRELAERNRHLGASELMNVILQRLTEFAADRFQNDVTLLTLAT